MSNISKDYLSGLTIRELSGKYLFKEGIINYWLRKLKLTRRRGVAPSLNVHYFKSIDTEYKAYFLGLLFADGHIDHTHNKRNYTINISLNAEDGYLIEKFASEIQTNLKVKYYSRTYKGKQRFTAQLSLGCKEMYEDLLNHGMCEIKIKNLNNLPDLSDNLMPHFIRGYFDGDGSIFVYNKTELGANFCGTYNFLIQLNNYLSKYIIPDPKSHSHGRKPFQRKNHATLHFSTTKMCKQLFDYLYKTPYNIYMVRKYHKFLMILKGK